MKCLFTVFLFDSIDCNACLCVSHRGWRAEDVAPRLSQFCVLRTSLSLIVTLPLIGRDHWLTFGPTQRPGTPYVLDVQSSAGTLRVTEQFCRSLTILDVEK